MTENVKKFQEALKNDADLKKKFDEQIVRIAKEKTAQSDMEAYVKAANELGYDISLSDMEKTLAESMEIDPDEMDNVAGGTCVANYDCYGAFMHAERQSKEESCWSDYSCVFAYHGGAMMQRPGCGIDATNPDNDIDYFYD